MKQEMYDTWRCWWHELWDGIVFVFSLIFFLQRIHRMQIRIRYYHTPAGAVFVNTSVWKLH